MFKFNRNNIEDWARKYDECCPDDDRGTEKRIKDLLKRQRHLTQKDLYDVLKWKSPRIIKYAKENAPSIIAKITRNSFETKDERNRIESLLGQKGGLRGVGYPVASTILHFAFPDKYPIMDFRVIRSLNLTKPSVYRFDFWEKYCGIIRRISEEYGLCIRKVDKALWQFDKEQHSHSNKCECND
jgi:hypothetical protein